MPSLRSDVDGDRWKLETIRRFTRYPAQPEDTWEAFIQRLSREMRSPTRKENHAHS